MDHRADRADLDSGEFRGCIEGVVSLLGGATRLPYAQDPRAIAAHLIRIRSYRKLVERNRSRLHFWVRLHLSQGSTQGVAEPTTFSAGCRRCD